MARRSNVIQRIVLRIDDRRTIERAIMQIGGTRRELQKLGAAELETIARYLKTAIGTPLIRRLKIYPPVRGNEKVRWASLKQKRYVLMLLRKKAKAEGHPNDIKYRRTGDFGDAWVCEFKVDKKRGTITMIVENTAERRNNKTGQMQKIQPFITGGLGLGKSKSSIRNYMKPMQPFHKDTGWQPSHPIVQEYEGKAQVKAQDLYQGRVERIVRKRYT